MADPITAGAATLEAVPVDVSWDDVIARLDHPDDGTGAARATEASPPATGVGDPSSGGRRPARAAVPLVILAAAAALVVVAILAIRTDQEDAGVATQPTTVTIADPAPPPVETTTAPATSSTTYDKAVLYEQARKDLLRNQLHEEIVAHLGERYGGARYDVNDLVVMVKGLTPDDQVWLDARSTGGVIRLEPTEVSRPELERAQAVITAELQAWSIESYATGLQLQPPAVSVVVQGHHEGLEARVRSLVTVPVTYAERDEAIGTFDDDVVPRGPG